VNRDKLRQLARTTDSWLEELEVQGTKQFVEAMRYAFLTPGKRFRAGCCQVTGELLGININNIKPLAIALELVHASTLVHDDLPALDNDSVRRGRATVHVEFGEAVALLVGDALIGEAFRILADAKLPAELIARFGAVYRTVCEGQILDLDVTIDSWERVQDRHQKKTGAMIELALTAPALLCEDRKHEAALRKFGSELGLLFQLVDDIRDATKSSEILGKTSDLDRQLGRVTAVSFLGLEKAQALAAETIGRCKAILPAELGELAIFVDLLGDRLSE